MDSHSQTAGTNDLILVPTDGHCTLIPQGDGTRIVLATLEIPFLSLRRFRTGISLTKSGSDSFRQAATASKSSP